MIEVDVRPDYHLPGQITRVARAERRLNAEILSEALVDDEPRQVVRGIWSQRLCFLKWLHRRGLFTDGDR